jgi:hypothetical protein
MQRRRWLMAVKGGEEDDQDMEEVPQAGNLVRRMTTMRDGMRRLMLREAEQPRVGFVAVGED